MRLGEEFGFPSVLACHFGGLFQEQIDTGWRDLSSAFVKTFITEYFVGLVVQASSYVFNGAQSQNLQTLF